MKQFKLALTLAAIFVAAVFGSAVASAATNPLAEIYRAMEEVDSLVASFDDEVVVRDSNGKIVDVYQDVGGYRFHSALDFDGAYSASCRVSVPGARGSGIFCGFRNGKCAVLTNHHVVGERNASATLQFLGTGARVEVRAAIFARWYNAQLLYDFAIMEVEPSEMAKTGAKYVPLAGEGVRPAVDSFIISSGAPKGRFVQAWRGKVLDYYNGETCLFEPGPVPGQSGSAIISELDERLWVTGILTWLIGNEGADDSKGGAIPISKLYEAARGKRKTSEVGAPSPIPPDAKECAEGALVRATARTGKQAEAPLEPLAVENGSGDVWSFAKQSDAPFVLEFTMANCEPCRKAEADVEAIKANEIPIYRLNVSTSKDAERRAEGLRVERFPTFVVFNADGKEVARFEGAGVSAKVIAAAQGALPGPLVFGTEPDVSPGAPVGRSFPDPLVLGTEPDVSPGAPVDRSLRGANGAETPSKPRVEELDIAENLPLTQDLTEEFFAAPEPDFREREPVEQPTDGNFFDDSDARWRNRNRRGDAPTTPKPKPSEPTVPEPNAPSTPPPQIDEARLGDRIAGLLGGRLKDGIADALGNEINGTVDELERRFDKKIEDKIETLGDKLLAKYNAVKWRLFMWFIASVVVSVFFAEAVKSLVAWVWNWTCAKFRALVNAEAKRIAGAEGALVRATARLGKQTASRCDAPLSETTRNATVDALADIDSGLDESVAGRAVRATARTSKRPEPPLEALARTGDALADIDAGLDDVLDKEAQ